MRKTHFDAGSLFIARQATIGTVADATKAELRAAAVKAAGERIAAIRKIRGMTAAALARRCGIDPSSTLCPMNAPPE